MGQTSVADTGEPRVDEIFADARSMQAAAVERLEAGDIRDAAEKAWCRRQACYPTLCYWPVLEWNPRAPTIRLRACWGWPGNRVGMRRSWGATLRASVISTAPASTRASVDPMSSAVSGKTGAYIDDAVDLAGAVH